LAAQAHVACRHTQDGSKPSSSLMILEEVLVFDICVHALWDAQASGPGLRAGLMCMFASFRIYAHRDVFASFRMYAHRDVCHLLPCVSCSTPSLGRLLRALNLGCLISLHPEATCRLQRALTVGRHLSCTFMHTLSLLWFTVLTKLLAVTGNCVSPGHPESPVLCLLGTQSLLFCVSGAPRVSCFVSRGHPESPGSCSVYWTQKSLPFEYCKRFRLSLAKPAKIAF
jgi:hypothetical protein